MEFVRQFFGTLPDAFSAFWSFGDGLYGLAVLGVSVLLFALFAFMAKRWHGRHGWLSAIFGMMAGVVAGWWLFAILPSAWIYYADGERDLLEGTVLPGPLPGMDNAYEVFRDTVVVGVTALATIIFAVVALSIQKRYPRGLAPGEEKTPSTGGYK